MRFPVPAPHPSWQAEPWLRVHKPDTTPCPMHPDDHERRQREQRDAEQHKQNQIARESRKHNPSAVRDAARETTDRAHGDGGKTTQQERKEKLMRLAAANIQARGMDRGGGRTRDR